MIYNDIINKYYTENNELKNILLVHSKSVTSLALSIISKHKELNADAKFVENAAMLHDIGIFLCNAPGIYCFGKEPYICHGHLGAELMREEGLSQIARVCERHTGAGITMQQIIDNNLPLPHNDFLPETIEEQIICYADKFFSKTHLDKTKTFEEAKKSLMKFGKEGVIRFCNWHEQFK